MNIENYPFPWTPKDHTVGKRTRIIIVDADGNEVCETFGETLSKARAVAQAIADAMNQKATA